MKENVTGRSIIWSIGSQDRSFSEFAKLDQPEDYGKRFPNDVNFSVGRSDQKKEWCFLHPGPTNWAGRKFHPFRIVFSLESVPPGEAFLHIDFVDVIRYIWGRAYLDDGPLYSVEINGFRQELYFPPGSGSQSKSSLLDDARGKPGGVVVPFSTSILKAGENTVALTVEEEGWVLYDALWMEVDESKKPTGHIRDVSVRDTILFKRVSLQAVEVVIENRGPAKPGEIVLELDGRAFSSSVEIGFGKTIHHILVPEFRERKDVKVKVKAGDETFGKTVSVGPRRKWSLFLAPAAHTDIGYTTIQPHIAEVHSRNLELAMEACRSMPGFKWNAEVSWHLQDFLKTRPHRTAELVKLTKDGRIGIEAIYAHVLTAICSHEALNRICYHAASLKKKHGIPLNSAMTTDIPGIVGSFPMVLAHSGIRYYSQGINQERGPIFGYPGAGPFSGYPDIKTPFYWESPDGSRVLTSFARHYGIRQAGKTGLHDSYKAALRRLPQFLEHFERDDYPYDAVLVHGTYADNHPLSAKFAKIAEEWNREWEYPKVIICKTSEFFQYIERNFDNLPTYRGEAGHFWEDGVASTALESSMHRWNQEYLITAEKLCTMGTPLDNSLTYPRSLLDEAWDKVQLWNEHTWGDGDSGPRPEGTVVKQEWFIKSSFVNSAKALVEKALEEGLHRLSSKIRGSEYYSLVIFNPFSWRGNQVVESVVSSPPFVNFDEDFELRDSRSNRTVPYQIVDLGSGQALCAPGYTMWRTVCFLMDDLPPLGYVSLDIIPRNREAPVEDGVRFYENGMENSYYRIEFDPSNGGIKRIFDKELQKELVDPRSSYRLNEYLYVTGGEKSKVIRPEPSLPPPKFRIHTPSWVDISRGVNGSLFGSMIVEAQCKKTPRIKTEVRLHSKTKRIDFINYVFKDLTYQNEAVYFAFPFNFENPEVKLEVPNGVFRPELDQWKGGCRDWYAVQHWATISDKVGTVIWSTVDAPLVSLCDINAGKWLEKLDIKNGTVFAYVMNNYWWTNYKAGQGGEFAFRFSITSHKGVSDHVRATHFGWSSAHPPLTTFLYPNKEGILPHEQASFLNISEPNVVTTALKFAEESDDVVVRLLEVEGRDATIEVSLPFHKIKEAYLCNLIEEKIQSLQVVDGKVRVPIKARGLATIKVKPNKGEGKILPTANPSS